MGDQTEILSQAQEVFLTPSDIGIRLDKSARDVNKKLEALKLQIDTRDYKNRLIWELTPKGKIYGCYFDTDKKNGSGMPITRIKWKETVLEMLKKPMLRVVN